jgi:predicted dehydrogenase/threonine dehydrogenase-like Zn-dependent dehydrogenase
MAGRTGGEIGVLQVAMSGGEVRVVEVPEPVVRRGCVLVRTSHSLISAGTESAGIGSGGRRENIVLRAIRNPALVKKVVDRVASHGLQATAELVRTRISTEMPSGYSCAGIVIEAGEDVSDIRAGDRVACAGAGHANHAGVNVVPRNLVAPIPDGVSFEEAAFCTLGGIAMQGVRRAEPALGDRVAVLGLGLLGQLTVQMLKAAGAVVIGVDVRPDRVARAQGLGLDAGFTVSERDFVAGVLERTGGRGADAVVVTAAGGDAGLLNKAFEACRRKGRVVLVGDVPIRIQRDKIYKKEIDFLISTSYGPGRYDPSYEEKGHDYPFGYVRWTEGRNLEEVLRQVAAGTLKVKPLIDATHGIEDASAAYASLASENRPIGILLDYHLGEGTLTTRQCSYAPLRRVGSAPKPGALGVGVVGYGAYFRSMLLPLLKAHAGFSLAAACARSGLTVRAAVEGDGFAKGTTDFRELLADPAVDVVYVATRHDLHYAVARAAVDAGKAVFVEKPMTTTVADARELVAAVARAGTLLTVGFNRRFSPHAVRLAELLRPIAAPKTLVYRVNAGALPPEHWLLDPVEGGGRLVGEGVHFFDMLRFLAASEPLRVVSVSPRGRARDEASVSIEFADGSTGSLVYTGAGAAGVGKERLEVFAGGASFVLDDYRSLEVFGLPKEGLKTRTVEKGQREQLEDFYRALRGKGPLGVTAEDGLQATWCAEAALASDAG